METLKKTPINYSESEAVSSFENFDKLLNTVISSESVKSKTKALLRNTRTASILAVMRTKAGLTQKEMAEKLGFTQGAISKIEMTEDSKLTLDIIHKYAIACNNSIIVRLGIPVNHVQAIKANAVEMRDHMLALSKLAENDAEIKASISTFFSEAFFNILGILDGFHHLLPEQKQQDPKIEINKVLNIKLKESAKIESANKSAECAMA